MINAAPIRPTRVHERQSHGGFRLQRIMGAGDPQSTTRSAIADIPPPAGIIGGPLPETLRFVDATSRIPSTQSTSGVAVQMLWTAPGSPQAILAGRDSRHPHDLVSYPAHPGDTLLVPPGFPFAPEVGSISFIAGASTLRPPAGISSAMPVQPPTHGLNLFHGHNRRTICLATPTLLIERWKLTGPLSLEISPNQPLYIANLVAPVAIHWPHGTDLLGRLESRIISVGVHRITVVPDGLGYLLVVSQPHNLSEIIDPLRAAGYRRADLLSIGIRS